MMLAPSPAIGSRATSRLPFKCCSALKAQSGELRPVKKNTVGIYGGVLLAGSSLGGAAFAEEAVSAASDAVTTTAAEVQAAAAPFTTTAPVPDDPIISAMFYIAVGALTVVTLGVAYLSFVTWNDSRTEEEDRKRVGSGGSNISSSFRSAPKAATSSGDELDGRPRKKKSAQTPSSSKGFGK